MKSIFYQHRRWLYLLLPVYAACCVWLLPRSGPVVWADDWLWQYDQPSASRVVHIVDIDDASLVQVGRWPWPREQIALLVEQLIHHYQVQQVGLDIVMSEPSPVDHSFAAAADDHVVWAVALAYTGELSVRQGALAAFPLCLSGLDLPEATGYLGLSEHFAQSNLRQGHIRPTFDSDGVIRQYPVFLQLNTECVPALALSMWGWWLGLSGDAPISMKQGRLYWGGIDTGTAGNGLLRLRNMRQAVGSVSAADVLNGTAELPPNAVVLIGSSALGIGDRVTLPGGEVHAGVAVHGYALAQWLMGATLAEPVWLPLPVFLAVLGALLVLFQCAKRSARLGLFVWCGMAVIWFFAALFGRLGWGLFWPIAPFVWSSLALLSAFGMRMYTLRRARGLLYRQFSAYVSDEVLQQLVASEADPRLLDSQRSEITVLFADIRGFTHLAEHLPPEETVRLVNQVMTYLGDHVARKQGTLDKFLGDGVMAFWGAPLAVPDHADRAVDCACNIINGLNELNADLRRAGLPTVALAIGVHTGMAAVGNMGSTERRAYSAIGDSVNLAARLQGLAGEPPVLVSAQVQRLCTAHQFDALGECIVRGRDQPVSVYVPLGCKYDGPICVPVIEPVAQQHSAG